MRAGLARGHAVCAGVPNAHIERYMDTPPDSRDPKTYIAKNNW